MVMRDDGVVVVKVRAADLFKMVVELKMLVELKMVFELKMLVSLLLNKSWKGVLRQLGSLAMVRDTLKVLLCIKVFQIGFDRLYLQTHMNAIGCFGHIYHFLHCPSSFSS